MKNRISLFQWFIITRAQNDIRRGGAPSIQEVLRLAPGVNVGRIDDNKSAISSRGFNGRFTNKPGYCS